MTRTKAVVAVDGDNTLWRGRAAEGIGKAYLWRELKRGHFGTFASGFRSAVRVKAAVASVVGAEGEALGQRMFYDVLVSHGLGQEREMRVFAAEYIEAHWVEPVRQLVLENVNDNIPVFLSTMTGSTAAEFAAERLHLTEAVCNRELFDSRGRLTGIDMRIVDGESKLRLTTAMLKRHGIELGECVVVGDSLLDIPLLRAAGKPMASPYAVPEVLALRGIVPI